MMSRAPDRRGFSLVETALAIGIVSFAMMAIVGVLPVGMKSMQDATILQAKASIAQQLRAELQQIPFGKEGMTDVKIASLDNSIYTYEGLRTTNSAEAYYKAAVTAGGAEVRGTDGSGATFQAENAQNVTVILNYPQSAPEKNQLRTVFCLFTARQKNN